MTVPSLCRSRFCGPPVISRSSSLSSDPARVGLRVALSGFGFGFEVEVEGVGRKMAGPPCNFVFFSSATSGREAAPLLSTLVELDSALFVLDPMGTVLPFSLKRVEPVLPLTRASMVVVALLVDAKGNPFLGVVDPVAEEEEEEAWGPQ